MTNRRPHWTDDLIEAVKDAISGWCFDYVEGPLYDEDVYPVIAAVEDWQIAKAGPGKYAITLGVIGGKYLPEWIAQSAIDRATKAEAKIQRVRELHRPSQSTIWSHDLQQAITVTTCRCGSEQCPCPTIEALDGAL